MAVKIELKSPGPPDKGVPEGPGGIGTPPYAREGEISKSLPPRPDYVDSPGGPVRRTHPGPGNQPMSSYEASKRQQHEREAVAAQAAD
jgi:hypothetical protein